MLEVAAIRIIDVGPLEWFDSIALKWPSNKDPADRLIVAFAMKRGLTVVTTDRKMKRFYKNIIW